MNWFLWVAVIWWALDATLFVAVIGKKFEITKTTAAFAVVIYTLLIAGMFKYGAS